MEPKREAHGYCDMCNQTPKCGVTVRMEAGGPVSVEDRADYPAGPLCDKGRAILEQQNHPDRLLHPVRRTTPKGASSPGWARISWDEALRTIASNLERIRARHGADKVCFFVGDPKEPRPAVQRLAYTFGSPNYGTESSLCGRASRMASRLTFGIEAISGRPSRVTRGCLIWSRNFSSSAPFEHERLLQAKKQGVKFVAVDPRATATTRELADIHLRPRPGTDGALALGMIHLMTKLGLHDQDFVSAWTHGFPGLERLAAGFPPEETERITWVRKDLIEAAVRLLAGNRPMTWIGSPAATAHSSNGLQNHRAILCLLALFGDFDAPGGLTVPTHPLPLDMLCATPEFTREADLFPALREKRADQGRFPVWARLTPELQMNFLPEYVEEGRVRAMILFGGNAMMWPQTRRYQEALDQLEFAAASDYFIRPWTHDHVDIVLPAAMALERTAPVAVFGRRVFLREPAAPPLGEARPDWTIAFGIAAHLGLGADFWDGSEEKALDAILSGIGLTVESLRQAGSAGATVPPPGPEVFRKYEVGLMRPDRKPGFDTPSGKVEFFSSVLEEHGFDPLPSFQEPVESPLSAPRLAKEFPLILNTGSRLPMFTHSQMREIASLRKLMPSPALNLHPRDAGEQGIVQGDEVLLESPYGRIQLQANITEDVLPGVVDAPHGWPEANVNEVVARRFDPISGFPAFKEGLCRVRKAAKEQR